MSEMRCNRTIDVGAYLLGGLATQESVELRAHIDGCAFCADTLAELQPLTEQLALTDLRTFAGLEVEQPSESLRGSILEQVTAEFQSEAVTTHPSPEVVDLASKRDLLSATAARSGRSFGWKAAAAAVVVAFGIGAGTSRVLQPSAPKRYFGAGPNAAQQKVIFASASTTGPKAWAYLSSDSAGTYAVMYTKGLSAKKTYKWWLEKADGTRVGMGSFEFPDGQQNWVVCPGGTSLERVEFTAIGVSTGGADVLRADLPAPFPS
jgi:Anti-sigma-K factor rskA